MRRKHRRIQYYSGEATRGRLRDKVWFPYAVIAAAALVLALIVGAVLGGIAEDSRLSSGVRKDLATFGGVDVSLDKYNDLISVRGGAVTLDGIGESALRDAISELPEGNAAGFTLYDGQGGVCFSPELQEKSDVSFDVKCTLAAEEIADAASAEDRYSVGYFVTGAFDEEDEQLRILETSREIALLCELAQSGIREIVIVGLPSDSDYAVAVDSYMRQASEVCGDAVLGVMISEEDAVSSGIARVVAGTNAYADSYFIDFREAPAAALGGYIEKNAYYLTAYNMRLMLNGTEREEALAVVESYELESYLFQ